MGTLCPPIKTYGIDRNIPLPITPIINVISVGDSFKLDAFKKGSLGTSTQVLKGNGIDETPIWVEIEIPIAIGSGPRTTGINAGLLHEKSITDDYEYECVYPGIAGVAIWKKKLLIST